uniref:Secreted protein n=1 Tax=Schizaphis graminum TaxID=13262 RepID=A0A2S2NN57_SCHGA
MKLSILLLTFVVTTLYARHVHQTSTNKSSDCKHQIRINGTIKCNTTMSITPVGRNSKQFLVSTTTKKYRRLGSTATKTENFHTSNTTQKYTKLKNTVTERVVIVADQKTTESSLMQTRFFIAPPIKNCKDGLTRDVNGDCVLNFPDD